MYVICAALASEICVRSWACACTQVLSGRVPICECVECVCVRVRVSNSVNVCVCMQVCVLFSFRLVDSAFAGQGVSFPEVLYVL